MKLTGMIAAAGLVISSLGMATAADAQHRRDNGRHHVQQRHHVERSHHRTRVAYHRNCRTVWINHHRVQRCR